MIEVCGGQEESDWTSSIVCILKYTLLHLPTHYRLLGIKQISKYSYLLAAAGVLVRIAEDGRTGFPPEMIIW